MLLYDRREICRSRFRIKHPVTFCERALKRYHTLAGTRKTIIYRCIYCVFIVIVALITETHRSYFADEYHFAPVIVLESLSLFRDSHRVVRGGLRVTRSKITSTFFI